jgi:hypothetical protein
MAGQRSVTGVNLWGPEHQPTFSNGTGGSSPFGTSGFAVESCATLTLGPATAPDADPVELNPERVSSLVLALLHTEVLSAVAFKSGALRIVFSNPMHLNVRPDQKYEAWTDGPMR